MKSIFIISLLNKNKDLAKDWIKKYFIRLFMFKDVLVNIIGINAIILISNLSHIKNHIFEEKAMTVLNTRTE